MVDYLVTRLLLTVASVLLYWGLLVLFNADLESDAVKVGAALLVVGLPSWVLPEVK